MSHEGDDRMMPTYRRWPIEIVSGRGCRVTDADGRSYLDMTAGLAVTALGHTHPAVTQAIGRQADKLLHVSNLYGTRPQKELAKKLASLTGGMRSFFTNSGAESVECAIKLARKWGRVTGGSGRYSIVATDGGFHGRTMGALAATGQLSKQAAFAPMIEGFVHVPYGDVDAIAGSLGRAVAAVLVEPVQGEGGVVVPPDGYLTELRRLCDRAGALLIVDEVQTGLGRTGNWFGFQHDGARPDVICLAKALGNGLPIGACLAAPEVAKAFAPGDHASTFGGGPLQCAVALAVLNTIEDNGLVERAAAAGERLARGLTEVFGERATVRGRGLMVGAVLDEDLSRKVAESSLDLGLLVNDVTPNVVRLTPPLIVEDSEIDEALTILDKAWAEIS